MTSNSDPATTTATTATETAVATATPALNSTAAQALPTPQSDPTAPAPSLPPDKVDPITAVQDSIDGLALSLFEALRGVRDAVAPVSLAAPGAAGATAVATAFFPDADELEKEATARERLLHGVNPDYFPPRAFDPLEPDYEAFILAYLGDHPYARELAERFAAGTRTDGARPPGTLTAASEVEEAADSPAAVKIGDVGYEFRKQFDAGWFTGKVTEIRPLAENGYDRRCVFSDGDIEDLRVKDLELLAKLDPENAKPASPRRRPKAAAGAGLRFPFPLAQAPYTELLRAAEHDRDVQTTGLLARDVCAKSRAVDDLVARLPGMGRTRQQQMERINELIQRNHDVTRQLEEAHAVAKARREEVRAKLGERTCTALGVEEEAC